MAKVKSVYVCRECGFETPKWNGKCPNCGAWNSLEETESVPVTKANLSAAKSGIDLSNKIVSLSDAETSADEVRYHTGLKELDRVLGGGLVKGSMVLLGGEPGIGKSTLALQLPLETKLPAKSTSPLFFFIGTDSPVSKLSLHSTEPSIKMQSATICLPFE